MLPNGYTAMAGISGGVYSYIDTGIVPTNDMSVQIAFDFLRDTTMGFIFGARNSNSNTSAGQLNLYMGNLGSADYFGYASARTSQTMPSLYSQDSFNFTSEMNEGTLVANNTSVSSFTGTSGATFTGTRTMHIMGCNNGGSHTATVSTTVRGFRIWKNGVLQAEFIPAYNESTSLAGMYESVSETFFGSATANTFNTGYLVDGQTDGHGKVVFKTDFGDVPQIRCGTYAGKTITAKAIANEGYIFKNWEIGGNIVSTDIEYTFSPNAATTITANFIKITDAIQTNNYTALALKWNSSTGQLNAKDSAYLQVIDFKINEDLMQGTTSTIVCKEIPSLLHLSVPLFLYDPKGRIIYYGAVQSIEGNTITCRDPLYLFDDDTLISTSNYNAYFTVLKYMSTLGTSTYKTNDVHSLPYDETVPLNSDVLVATPMPQITQTSVANAESTMRDMFNSYNLLYEYSLAKVSNTLFLGMKPVNPMTYDTLYLGDNMEQIRNIKIVEEEVDATYLRIFNSAGTQVRAEFGMKKDGTIGQIVSGININDFVFSNLYKLKIVLDDGNLKNIAKANLNGSLYNHKIDFDLELNGIRLEDLKLGQRVIFYYKNEIYDSMLTAWSYSMQNNEVETMHITMGVARNNLTSKLNLGKVK